MNKTVPAAKQPTPAQKMNEEPVATTPVEPGIFELTPGMAKRFPTGCNPGETQAQRDKRLGRR